MWLFQKSYIEKLIPRVNLFDNMCCVKVDKDDVQSAYSSNDSETVLALADAMKNLDTSEELEFNAENDKEEICASGIGTETRHEDVSVVPDNPDLSSIVISFSSVEPLIR